MIQLSSRAARAAAVAAIAIGAAACSSRIDGPTARPIGVAQIDVNGDATPTSARPTVTFIRAFGLNVGDTRNPGDTCETLLFDETTGPANPVAGVSAGEAIQLVLSGTTTTLVPTDQTVGRVYAPASQGTVTFQPGDSAKLSIPGSAGGFPAGQFALKTAEPVIFTDPIPVPASNSTANMTVKWNAGDENSAMLLSLRYQSANENRTRQLLCLMEDDGEYTISNARLAAWQAAGSTDRRAVATRVRNSATSLEGATMYGSTSFRKTIPLAP